MSILKGTTKKIIISLVGLSLLFALIPLTTNAQESIPGCKDSNFIEEISGRVRLNVPLPGITDTRECNKSDGGISTYYLIKGEGKAALSSYIQGFYVYFVWVVGILAAIMIMYAGIQWITAAGDASKITNAKATMNGAVIGLILTLTSYVLLATINPDLVNFRVSVIVPVAPQFAGGFCQTIDGIDYQELAEKKGDKCGDVFEYQDPEVTDKKRIILYCMSQSCQYDTESCIDCRGEGEPYDSCSGRKFECGYYDSFIEIKGTVASVAPENEVKKIELFRTCPDCPPAQFWQKVGELKGKENFELNDTFVIESKGEDPHPLTQFKMQAYFDNNLRDGNDRICVSVDPAGESNCYVFEIPFKPGGPATKEFTFDFQRIWARCGQPCS